jgi:hypothetical protein
LRCVGTVVGTPKHFEEGKMSFTVTREVKEVRAVDVVELAVVTYELTEMVYGFNEAARLGDDDEWNRGYAAAVNSLKRRVAEIIARLSTKEV